MCRGFVWRIKNAHHVCLIVVFSFLFDNIGRYEEKSDDGGILHRRIRVYIFGKKKKAPLTLCKHFCMQSLFAKFASFPWLRMICSFFVLHFLWLRKYSMDSVFYTCMLECYNAAAWSSPYAWEFIFIFWIFFVYPNPLKGNFFWLGGCF